MTRTPPRWENIPGDIGILPNWVLWEARLRDGKVTKAPLDIYGSSASTTAPHTWKDLPTVKGAFEKGKGHGVGFVFKREHGITGVDLDHCRDPETGEIDEWAKRILDTLSSYSEISPSRTGVHIFVKGVLPEGVNGRKHMLKGDDYREGAAIEMYCDGRYFTVTGERLLEYPPTIEDRQDQLNAIYARFFGNDEDSPQKRERELLPERGELTAPVNEDEDEALLQKIRRSAQGALFVELFDQGDTSRYGGDDSAADMALCNMLAFWTANDPVRMDRLFRKSRLYRPKWDERRGVMTYGERTIKEAISHTTEVYSPIDGILSPSVESIEIPSTVRRWREDLPPHVPGVDTDGNVYVKTASKKGGEAVKVRVCDGYAYISEETRDAAGEATFTVEGIGTRDFCRFRFDISGRDFGDPRKLRALLTAHFGARNRVGGLTGEMIQSLTLETRKLKLITAPTWIDNKLAIPGIDDSGYKFRFNPRVPVNLSTGEMERGVEALRLILEAWARATIPLATVLASPVCARWFLGDRFGIALTGTTGRAHKTETLKHLLAIYGEGFLDEGALLRWGEGATVNAMLTIASACGCVPVGIDNYKATHRDSATRLVSTVHVILEGRERERLNRNAELRESREYTATLLVTGEDFPEEASTISRLIPWEWSTPTNVNNLSKLQRIARHLPAIGRAWCRYLTTAEIDLDEWGERRARLVEVAHEAGAVNPGRIGTTSAILQETWRLALASPLGEVLRNYTQRFENDLMELILSTAERTREATEAHQFVETLKELISAGRYRILESLHTGNEVYSPNSNVIGWRLKDGGIAIMPRVATDAVRRVMGPQGQEVTTRTLYRQLDEAGMIICGDPSGRLTTKRIGSTTVRVLVFKPGVLDNERSEPERADLPGFIAVGEKEALRKQAAEALHSRMRDAVRVF